MEVDAEKITTCSHLVSVLNCIHPNPFISLQKGETLVDEDCVQQCQCMGNNAMQCTAMKCAANEVCKGKDGVKGCFLFEPVTCSVYGDPHYITFDKFAYDFQGGCSYTLTTTCGGESLVQFTVIGHNMQPSLQNFTRSKLDAVTLQVDDMYLTLNQSGDVYVSIKFSSPHYCFQVNYGAWWPVYRTGRVIYLYYLLKLLNDAC